jgi:hypothetical protein
MKKKGQIGIGLFVTLFIGIIFAIAMLNPIASTTNQMTDKQDTTNQSISTITGYVSDSAVDESINYSIYSQSAWKVIDCPLTSVEIRNGAGTVLTSATDYTLDEDNGRFSLLSTVNTYPSTTLNLTYVDYTYCADGYAKDGSSRSIINIILIFSALTILAFSLIGIKDMLK